MEKKILNLILKDLKKTIVELIKFHNCSYDEAKQLALEGFMEKLERGI